ncbi:hypothetical protein EYF80_037665 [Liparis tanakae]|uniref:Uncharacterized protein n=1 Tax=Liparis tanakae TaxID=230148 RepID=A0A4Z2GF18_9TELE|nr:hypothetical protein EYF80_037665 [Liparis tanakae]
MPIQDKQSAVKPLRLPSETTRRPGNTAAPDHEEDPPTRSPNGHGDPANVPSGPFPSRPRFEASCWTISSDSQGDRPMSGGRSLPVSLSRVPWVLSGQR